jgi:nucleotide-binding universal stress UspA family protein
MNTNIVVGVDGSSDSLAALNWSAGLAGKDGVIHAVHTTSPGEAIALAAVQVDGTQFREAARGELEGSWTAEARSTGARIVCRVVESSPSVALHETANAVGADMIAVGAHGHRRGQRPLVGSTTRRLLHECDLPVAVIRSGCPPIGNGPVIIGIGDGKATAAALAWGVRLARDRHGPVELVHVVAHHHLLLPSPNMKSALEKAAQLVDRDLPLQWAKEDLSRVAAGIAQDITADGIAAHHEQCEVTTTVMRGDTGPSLVAASERGSVIVLGKHFDGPVTGYFHSVALQHVLTHARTAVIVVGQRVTS